VRFVLCSSRGGGGVWGGVFEVAEDGMSEVETWWRWKCIADVTYY
jgi:hypothetical protein